MAAAQHTPWDTALEVSVSDLVMRGYQQAVVRGKLHILACSNGRPGCVPASLTSKCLCHRFPPILAKRGPCGLNQQVWEHCGLVHHDTGWRQSQSTQCDLRLHKQQTECSKQSQLGMSDVW